MDGGFIVSFTKILKIIELIRYDMYTRKIVLQIIVYQYFKFA